MRWPWQDAPTETRAVQQLYRCAGSRLITANAADGQCDRIGFGGNRGAWRLAQRPNQPGLCQSAEVGAESTAVLRALTPDCLGAHWPGVDTARPDSYSVIETGMGMVDLLPATSLTTWMVGRLCRTSWRYRCNRVAALKRQWTYDRTYQRPASVHLTDMPVDPETALAGALAPLEFAQLTGQACR